MESKQTPSSEPKSLYTLIREGVPEGQHLLHVVAFKFLATTDEARQVAIMNECSALHERCGGSTAGIVSSRVVRNIDPRKGFTWVEVMVFAGAEAFVAFHAHPEHKAFAEQMANLADVWVVQDIPVPPGTVV